MRQRQSHRPGTNKGRETAVRLFLAFCRRANLHYTRIAYQHICWYIEYLSRHYTSPASISNAISHLRTFYSMSGLSTKPLYHNRVLLALRAISITIRHTPTPSPPVSPQALKDALSHIHDLHSSEATHLALLLMFMGFLRQSSVAPLTVRSFDPTRHLTVADVTPTTAGLSVHIKWTKTLQSSADATDILLPRTQDALMCPVSALRRYNAVAPTSPGPTAPLLRHRDGNTLTVPFIRRQWDALIKKAAPHAKRSTLHSLRRGAAQYTYNDARADLNDVMTHGTWRSQAVRSYIRPEQTPANSVYRALETL